MRIYTGRGDEGQTDLRDGSRVSKASPIIEAYGTVDELNAVIGTVLPTGHEDVDDRLKHIQNDLHTVQAELANPSPDEDAPRVTTADVDRLESWMDAADEELDPLKAFVLPGGFAGGSGLHHARTVCRRAERRAVAAVEAAEGEIGPVLVYLNRLSDTLFVFARLLNEREGFEDRSPTY